MSLAWENRGWAQSPYGHGESVNTNASTLVSDLLDRVVNMTGHQLRRNYVGVLQTLLTIAEEYDLPTDEIEGDIKEGYAEAEGHRWWLLASIHDRCSFNFEKIGQEESGYYTRAMTALRDRMDAIKAEGIAA